MTGGGVGAIDYRRVDPRLWPAAQHGQVPRRFALWRERDRSGVSGTGVVAMGVQFPSGQCYLDWLRAPGGQESRRCLADVERIHGHHGDTIVLWIDDPR